MLDRTEFMQRVSDQDARIIDRVRTARADAKQTAEHLGVLEVRQTKVAAAIEARRDEVSRVRGQLVDRRDQFAAVRSRQGDRTGQHARQPPAPRGRPRALEAANAKIQAQLAPPRTAPPRPARDRSAPAPAA